MSMRLHPRLHERTLGVAVLAFASACGSPAPSPAAQAAPAPRAATATPTPAPAPIPAPPPPAAPPCQPPALAESEWAPLIEGARELEPSGLVLETLRQRCIADPQALASRLNDIGLAWHRRRDYDASSRFFRTATQVNPDSNAARFNLACALSKAGDLDGALAALVALGDHPDAARWRANAARDGDLSPLWNKPGAWKAITEEAPRLLVDRTLESPLEALGTIAATVPASDESLAWQEVTLDAATTSALIARLNESGQLGSRFRERYRVRIGPPEGYSPIVSYEGGVPASMLQIIRKPALWRPEPGVVVLVLPIRAYNDFFNRAGIAVFHVTPSGLVFYGHFVDSFTENHGVEEDTDAVVTRDRSAVGEGSAFDGDLSRGFVYVREGRFYRL